MRKLLVVVDMQNDFVHGSLGSEEARKIECNVVNKIRDFDGDVVVTMDTHDKNYLCTNEGKKLPVKHCIKLTDGWALTNEVNSALTAHHTYKTIFKETFGSLYLADYVAEKDYEEIEMIGVCTDICVISNALILKARCPEINITVDASCCAGVTPESHQAALTTMKMCQINVIGE